MPTTAPTSNAVLVTGCSSGIGRATALRLAAAGHVVYATARRPEAISDLESSGCRTLALDVTDEASMRDAVATIERAHGAVGALINNAGFSQSGAIETVTLDQVRRQFETNVFGLLRLTQLVLPGMRAQRAGRIVNVSSMGGKLTFPGMGAYHASKYAVEALSDALRFEVRGFGIKVVVVEPGLIRTRFSETAVSNMDSVEREGPYGAFNAAVAQSTVEGYEKGVMSRLAGEADDVARVIAKAITKRRPRTRYTVTASAVVLLTQRRWMSDRMWDGFMGTLYPQPGTSSAERELPAPSQA